ncbi:MAG: hypothetical protein QOI95_3576 [Acidimicrobiaceae bacterium]|jgi:hypothetical protein
MVLIGFVLLAAAAAFGLDLAIENYFSIDVDAFNQVFTTSASAVFVAGVVTGLTGALGLMLMRDGLVRRRRRRLEAREADEHRERHIAALENEHAAQHRTTDDHDGDRAPVDLRERDRDRDHVTTF